MVWAYRGMFYDSAWGSSIAYGETGLSRPSSRRRVSMGDSASSSSPNLISSVSSSSKLLVSICAGYEA